LHNTIQGSHLYIPIPCAKLFGCPPAVYLDQRKVDTLKNARKSTFEVPNLAIFLECLDLIKHKMIAPPKFVDKYTLSIRSRKYPNSTLPHSVASGYAVQLRPSFG
jgi:hypothetical protein